ncbi:MAG: DUF6036 family nucleotidyltransferase [Methanosarcinales archaeon]
MDDIWNKIVRAKDLLRRRLLFIGWLTHLLEKHNIKPILVGGNALEFYTLGRYSTYDIDLVSSGRNIIDKELRKKGFKKTGRHWYNENIDISVEIPDTILAGSLDKVETIEIDGLKVYVISKEDLIIDRLNAYVYWKSIEDGRWAKTIMILYYDELDWNYLNTRATEE